MSATTVNVGHPPDCDICLHMMGRVGVTAEYDGKTSHGPWAYMCPECFDAYGMGLGVGLGQRLVVA
jgi:hypothetical protein